MSAKRTKSTMSAKMQRFVAEYLTDYNATQAAKRAGYSAKSAGWQGAENMQKPAVIRAIAEALEQQQKRTLITADQVLLDIQTMGNKALAAEDYTNALRSRELLGKRYKLFTDRVEVMNNTPRAERLRAARERRGKIKGA
jgi:phage terminase small subunit